MTWINKSQVFSLQWPIDNYDRIIESVSRIGLVRLICKLIIETI